MLSLLAAHALAAAPPPIVNGDTTSDYEEVVLLYMTDSSGRQGGMCTGSVISDRWVLTASHCVKDSGGFTIERIYVIFADSLNSAEQSDIVNASDWFAHPEYSSRTGEHDIALVKMSQKVDGPYMALAGDNFRQRDRGEEFRLVGFGATSDNDASSNPKKRVAEVPLYDYTDLLVYTYDPDDGQNACYGDSGGPMMRLYEDGTYAIAGIMDFVSGCEDGYLGSARVDAHLDWISEYTEDYTLGGEEVEDEPAEDDEDDKDDVPGTGDGDGTGTDDESGDDDDGGLLDASSDSGWGCAVVPAAGGVSSLLGALAMTLAAGTRRRR